jgi:hypothetical protein
MPVLSELHNYFAAFFIPVGIVRSMDTFGAESQLRSGRMLFTSTFGRQIMAYFVELAGVDSEGMVGADKNWDSSNIKAYYE